MNFYHFTSVVMAESIFFGGISKGHLIHSDGRITQPIVWLTTDQRPNGHGLLNGKEVLSKNDIRHIERVEGKIKNKKTADKTQVRLKVQIKSTDRLLTRFCDEAKKEDNTGLWARLMGLSCYIDTSLLQSANEISDKYRQFETKESTWWLYKGVVKPEQIVGADRILGDKIQPYDLNKNGRE